MLDFLVIGAQKSGTTALHSVLERSPQFQVPQGKELPILNGTAPAPVMERELARLFSVDWRQGRTTPPYVGKVTPQYLMSRAAPFNIAALTPQAALIAVLRDPWERAFSHYRMAVGRGLEQRSFLHAIEAEARSLRAQELHLPDFDGYADTNFLAGSLYGALLTRYAEAGLREQVTILDHRAMQMDWDAFAAAFCRAVKPAADPDALSPPKPTNVSDDRMKLSHFATRLASIPGIRHTAQVVPHRFRHVLWWRLNEVPTRPSRTPAPPLQPPPLSATTGLVRDLLNDDAERLQRLQLRGTDDLLGQAPGAQA